MTFRALDLMVDVMPAIETAANGLMMNDCTVATGNPPPKPESPTPPPCTGASAVPKSIELSAGDSSLAVLAQLHEQLHEALGA